MELSSQSCLAEVRNRKGTEGSLELSQVPQHFCPSVLVRPTNQPRESWAGGDEFRFKTLIKHTKHQFKWLNPSQQAEQPVPLRNAGQEEIKAQHAFHNCS